MTPTAARVIYPELPDPLTPSNLQQLFSSSFDERNWAPTVTRTVESQVALLVQLKIFQSTGRFRRAADVPHAATDHVAHRMGVEFGSNLIFPDRTLYRHRQAILKRLKVVSWGTEAHALDQTTTCKTAQARMRLLAGASSSTTDRLCASLFAAVLERQPRADALRLHARHLLSHVDVIRFLDPSALTCTGIARSGLRVLDVEEPRTASVLLWNGSASDDEVPDNDEEFLAALRDAAAEGTRRDVLAALSQTDVLLDHQRTLLHQYAFDLEADTFQATRRLEAVWSACDELMAPTEARLKVIVDEAREMMQPGQDAGVSVNKRLLRLTWLARSVELAARQRDSAADTLIAQARARSPELAERVVRDFQAEDYRAGFALLHGGVVPVVEPNRLGGRRTIWRGDALTLWPEPILAAR